jgi:hypothetical protein
MINNKCYPSGGKHTGGCATCDPKTSTTAWTVQGSFCLINDVCKKPLDKDSTGCGVCDPTKSKTSWTAVTNHCLIGSTCYKDQATDKTGCLMCDYAKSSKAWTPVASAKTVAYDFESGKTTGWTITNSDTSVGWVVSSKRAAGGKYSLYYGDPSAGDYDTGGQNYGTAQLPAFTPTTGKKAGLTFSLWMDTESLSSYDVLEVYANTTKVWSKTTTTVSSMKTWLEISIDLSSYAGKSVTIKFKFDTKDSYSNSTEGLYIDDITIYHNC